MGETYKRKQKVGPVEREVSVDTETGVFVVPDHPKLASILNFAVRLSRAATRPKFGKMEIIEITTVASVASPQFSKEGQVMEPAVYVQGDSQSWT